VHVHMNAWCELLLVLCEVCVRVLLEDQQL